MSKRSRSFSVDSYNAKKKSLLDLLDEDFNPKKDFWLSPRKKIDPKKDKEDRKEFLEYITPKLNREGPLDFLNKDGNSRKNVDEEYANFLAYKDNTQSSRAKYDQVGQEDLKNFFELKKFKELRPRQKEDLLHEMFVKYGQPARVVANRGKIGEYYGKPDPIAEAYLEAKSRGDPTTLRQYLETPRFIKNRVEEEKVKANFFAGGTFRREIGKPIARNLFQPVGFGTRYDRKLHFPEDFQLAEEIRARSEIPLGTDQYAYSDLED